MIQSGCLQPYLIIRLLLKEKNYNFRIFFEHVFQITDRTQKIRSNTLIGNIKRIRYSALKNRVSFGISKFWSRISFLGIFILSQVQKSQSKKIPESESEFRHPKINPDIPDFCLHYTLISGIFQFILEALNHGQTAINKFEQDFIKKTIDNFYLKSVRINLSK